MPNNSLLPSPPEPMNSLASELTPVLENPVAGLSAVEADTTASSLPQPTAQPESSRPRAPWRAWRLFFFAFATLFAGGFVLRTLLAPGPQTGTLVVTLTEPNVQLFVDGEAQLTVESGREGRLVLPPGEHRLTVKRGAEDLYTEAFTLQSGEEIAIGAQWTSKAQRAIHRAEAVALRLKERNPNFDGKVAYKVQDGVVIELEFAADEVTDLAPVRALAGLRSLLCRGSDGRGKLADLAPLSGMNLVVLDCSGTRVSNLAPLKEMQLAYLSCSRTRVADLSPLSGIPLTYLNCGGCPVSDLSPLADMKLTELYCWKTRVSDLSALKNLPLTELHCGLTDVADLSPLKQLPLTVLGCPGTSVSDLSPLRGLPLKELWCDFKPERDTEIVRSLKTLEKINGQPVAEFWQGVDARRAEKKP